MSLENVIIPSAIALVVGIILLFLEYRTSWFQNNFVKKSEKITESEPQQALEFSGSVAGMLNGRSVTPVSDLENPTGDWIQIAKEVRMLLVDLYDLKVNENGKYLPDIQFFGIEPVKNSLDKEIIFDVTTNFDIGTVCIRVEPSGRVVSCKYERM